MQLRTRWRLVFAFGMAMIVAAPLSGGAFAATAGPAVGTTLRTTHKGNLPLNPAPRRPLNLGCIKVSVNAVPASDNLTSHALTVDFAVVNECGKPVYKGTWEYWSFARDCPASEPYTPGPHNFGSLDSPMTDKGSFSLEDPWTSVCLTANGAAVPHHLVFFADAEGYFVNDVLATGVAEPVGPIKFL